MLLFKNFHQPLAGRPPKAEYHGKIHKIIVLYEQKLDVNFGSYIVISSKVIRPSRDFSAPLYIVLVIL